MNCRVEFQRKEKPTITKRLTSTNYTLYALILCSILLSILWLQHSLPKSEKIESAPTKVLPVLTKNDVSIEPLTYMDGWEVAPTLSYDKSLLAFSYKRNRKLPDQVTIQNLENQKTVVVEPHAETVSPYWSPEHNELFYKSLSKDKCFIKKVQIHPNLTLATPELITSCGQRAYFNSDSAITISTDSNWLYFIFSNEKASLRVIKRFHLKNHKTETLTAPIVNSAGDLKLTLSPDNKQLAFLREHDDLSMEIMVLNLISGELNSVIKLPYLPFSLTWSKFTDYLIYVGEDGNTLNAINIKTGNIIPIYQYSKQIIEPKMISEAEFLLSFGDMHSSNIKLVDLNQTGLPSYSLINSNFKDHSAALHINNKLERVAFVSDRSGNYQIWLKENSILQQLTHFIGKPYIENMTFSANGENLLFLKDRKLHVLNISSKVLTPVTPPSNSVKNFIWQCNSNENVLMIAKEQGVWGLYQVNIPTQNTKLLTTDLTSIHGLCGSGDINESSYFAASSTNKGIFKLTNDWNINKSKQYLADISDVDLSDNRFWAITKSALYYINDDSIIFKYDFATQQNKKMNFPDIDTYHISIQNNKLILNDLKIADTFIGKITIPGLNERLSNN